MTDFAIHRRGPDQSPFCHLCSREVEAALHLVGGQFACRECLVKHSEALQPGGDLADDPSVQAGTIADLKRDLDNARAEVASLIASDNARDAELASLRAELEETREFAEALVVASNDKNALLAHLNLWLVRLGDDDGDDGGQEFVAVDKIAEFFEDDDDADEAGGIAETLLGGSPVEYGDHTYVLVLGQAHARDVARWGPGRSSPTA